MSFLDELSGLYSPELGLGTIVVRLAVACVLGMVIGIEREIRDIPAGLRTHMLVSVAAAVFTLVTFELLAQARAQGVQNVDPIRVVEAVTAGVAFLAAGSIIQARGRVRGLTTGAGLWLAGAVGTASGAGAYAIAILAAVLGFVIVALLRRLEKKLPGRDRAGQGAAKDHPREPHE